MGEKGLTRVPLELEPQRSEQSSGTYTHEKISI